MNAQIERVALEVQKIIGRHLAGEEAAKLQTLCTDLINRGGDDPAADIAPVRETIAFLVEKWTGLVLYLLAGGPIRYSLLCRLVSAIAALGGDKGISERMMTLTLRRLERDGFASRTILPAVPPHTIYCLTPLGHALHERLLLLVHWLEDHRTDIASARNRYDEAASG